jgi:hypothetical protein
VHTVVSIMCQTERCQVMSVGGSFMSGILEVIMPLAEPLVAGSVGCNISSRGNSSAFGYVFIYV